MDTTAPPNWKQLPPELLCLVMRRSAGAQDLRAASSVCTEWRAALAANQQALVEGFVHRRFPHVGGLLAALPAAGGGLDWRHVYADQIRLLPTPPPAPARLTEFVWTLELRTAGHTTAQWVGPLGYTHSDITLWRETGPSWARNWDIHEEAWDEFVAVMGGEPTVTASLTVSRMAAVGPVSIRLLDDVPVDTEAHREDETLVFEERALPFRPALAASTSDPDNNLSFYVNLLVGANGVVKAPFISCGPARGSATQQEMLSYLVDVAPWP